MDLCKPYYVFNQNYLFILLGVLWAASICSLPAAINFEYFLASISSYISSALISLFSFWHFNYMSVTSFEVVPTQFIDICYSFYFSLSISVWEDSTDIFKHIDSFLSDIHSADEPIKIFFIFVNGFNF